MLLLEEGMEVEVRGDADTFLPYPAGHIDVRAVPDRHVVVQLAVEQQLAGDECVDRILHVCRIVAVRYGCPDQRRPTQPAAFARHAGVEQEGGCENLALEVALGLCHGALGLDPPPVEAADADVRADRLREGRVDLLHADGSRQVDPF